MAIKSIPQTLHMGQRNHLKQPNFFIVGAPKCGTTALDSYLKQHPEIFIPNAKELHYFGSDLQIKNPLSLDTYLTYFGSASQEKRIGESSVWYLYSNSAAAEIKEFCPHARIIIMLRNPVDMLYSLHSQNLYSGAETIKDFQEALAAEENRKQGKCIPPSYNWKNSHYSVKTLYYREVIKYCEQIERYLQQFPREQIHIILFDDLKKNTTQVYQNTLRFLEVGQSFTPDFSIVNPNKNLRFRFVRDFLRNPPEILRHIVRLLLPKPVKQSVFDYLKRLNTSYTSRKPMPVNLRKQLQKEFRPEVEALSKLVGQDLSHWCEPAGDCEQQKK